MNYGKPLSRITLIIWSTIAVILVMWSVFLNPAEAKSLFYPAVNYDVDELPFSDDNVDEHPFSVAIGDLNGDDHPDLAVANEWSGNVSVLLGDGDGSFQSAVHYGAGGGPHSVAIGDFNGDDALDLAVANEWSGNVSVLLGNGDGSFQSAVHYGAGARPSSVAIGDFNGDGYPDLAVVNYLRDNLFSDFSDDLSVLLGNGDGSF
jgi:hypothetical protein